jgi:transposase-like protein
MSSRTDPQTDLTASDRRCPFCGSADVRLVTRGYTGPTDETDQYFTCNTCHRVTYELVAKNAREMRLGRWRAGGVYREPTTQVRYHISRILKVGVNEFLIYLRPMPEETAEAAAQ